MCPWFVNINRGHRGRNSAIVRQSILKEGNARLESRYLYAAVLVDGSCVVTFNKKDGVDFLEAHEDSLSLSQI